MNMFIKSVLSKSSPVFPTPYYFYYIRIFVFY